MEQFYSYHHPAVMGAQINTFSSTPEFRIWHYGAGLLSITHQDHYTITLFTQAVPPLSNRLDAYV